MAHPVHLSDDTFQSHVDSGEVLLVDFWAAWCGPCRAIAPLIDELANEYDGKATIAKVDVDSNPNAAAAMGVRGIPALFIFKNGQIVSNRAGAAPKAALQSWIESAI